MKYTLVEIVRHDHCVFKNYNLLKKIDHERSTTSESSDTEIF
jgi:hypothetical protein